mgnify:FL=1
MDSIQCIEYAGCKASLGTTVEASGNDDSPTEDLSPTPTGEAVSPAIRGCRRHADREVSSLGVDGQCLILSPVLFASGQAVFAISAW